MIQFNEQTDQLIDLCNAMGFGFDINAVKGYIDVTTSKGRRRRFKDVASALQMVQEARRNLVS